jgi:hypothetical protein
MRCCGQGCITQQRMSDWQHHRILTDDVLTAGSTACHETDVSSAAGGCQTRAVKLTRVRRPALRAGPSIVRFAIIRLTQPVQKQRAVERRAYLYALLYVSSPCSQPSDAVQPVRSLSALVLYLYADSICVVRLSSWLAA